MKREENTEPLKAVIDRFLKDFKLDEKYEEKHVAHIWKEMLGELIARKTRSISLRKGVLEVSLDSAVIRDELSYAKEKLKERLNETIGKDIITEIRLR